MRPCRRGAGRGPGEIQPFAHTDRDRGTLQLWDSAREEVEMRIFVDGSVVEMFIDGLSVTTRVYPSQRDSAGVRLAALGGVVHLRSVELWPLAEM
jgi:sucrose-6-phosphate hydrolase SacC (GH32 family)